MNFFNGFCNGLNLIKEMLSLEFIGFMTGLLFPLFILSVVTYFIFLRD